MATTRSRFPSPFRSATAMALGAPDVATAGATRKVLGAFGMGVAGVCKVTVEDAGVCAVEPEAADVCAVEPEDDTDPCWVELETAGACGDWLRAGLTDWAEAACATPRLQVRKNAVRNRKKRDGKRQ